MASGSTLISSLRTGLLAVPQVRSAIDRIRDLADPDRRAIARMNRTHSSAILQPWPTTCEDRYPEIFTALDAHLWTLDAPRILSFGCGDGSEVRSLRLRFKRADPMTLLYGPDNARMEGSYSDAMFLKER